MCERRKKRGEDLHSIHTLVCRELENWLRLECWSILTEDSSIARNMVYCSSNTGGKGSFREALL